jgi:transglutaminase-like putative cysteine protease
MRLNVRHHTVYAYSRPITYAIQTLRLTPRPHEGLSVYRWRVRSDSRKALPSFTDGFGNFVHSHSVNRLHETSTIFVDGEVETRDTGGIVRAAPETFAPLFYLRGTALTAATGEIPDFAQFAVAGATPMDRLMSLMDAVKIRVIYRSGITHPATTAAEALGCGVGVCQDHAHLFIAAARHMGFPARYVGGYVWTGDDPNEPQASHAWAEAYVADIGWIGFDASHGTRATEAHIRTAIGLDYWSAAPIRGIRRGEAEEKLDVEVQVLQSAAQQ